MALGLAIVLFLTPLPFPLLPTNTPTNSLFTNALVKKTETLALTEASYFTIRILQTFSVLENRDDKPFEESIGVVFNSGRGVKVCLRR